MIICYLCCVGSSFLEQITLDRILLHLELNVHVFNKLLQEALEAHDGASKGKYTIGLGQDCMAYCSEVEDVISMRYLPC
mgnify:CR=1 FL=1|jgi:hypothetical protein